MDKEFQAYKTNVTVRPAKKDVVLSSSTNAPKYWLYGEVISVGSEVKDIHIGDLVGYDKFGIKDVDKDGEKTFFIADDPAFILGIIHTDKCPK